MVKRRGPPSQGWRTFLRNHAPDRSDQPFGEAVLPGRGWCGRLVPDTHGTQSACDDAAIDPIAIADEVTRSFIPRKCLRYLTCNPPDIAAMDLFVVPTIGFDLLYALCVPKIRFGVDAASGRRKLAS